MTSKNVAQSTSFCFVVSLYIIHFVSFHFIFCRCLVVMLLFFFSDVNQARQYCSNRMGIFVACLSFIIYFRVCACVCVCLGVYKYFRVSSISNCIDCSVIVNMSIVSSLEIVPCVLTRSLTTVEYTMCTSGDDAAAAADRLLSHKWHSFWSDDNFNFTFCYLFSLRFMSHFFYLSSIVIIIVIFFFSRRRLCVSSSSRWFVI